MADKSSSGRETRKPKQEQNKKQKGQTPPSASASTLDAVAGRAAKKK